MVRIPGKLQGEERRGLREPIPDRHLPAQGLQPGLPVGPEPGGEPLEQRLVEPRHAEEKGDPAFAQGPHQLGPVRAFGIGAGLTSRPPKRHQERPAPAVREGVQQILQGVWAVHPSMMVRMSREDPRFDRNGEILYDGP